jgi:8-oxo-dGTP pyrophosphatase MutT (NUDIX family)
MGHDGADRGRVMALEDLRRAFEPIIRRFLHLFWRFSRGLTLGVRAAVIDGQGRVFLIRHSYVAGWHLPGGGVETGETIFSALTRELAEEGNITLAEPPVLHGVFFNARVSRRDHVAVFVVRAFHQDAPPQPNHEIIAHGFFHPGALPEDTTQGTRRRIAEVFDGVPISERW